jgi:hypothetical protein
MWNSWRRGDKDLADFRRCSEERGCWQETGSALKLCATGQPVRRSLAGKFQLPCTSLLTEAIRIVTSADRNTCSSTVCQSAKGSPLLLAWEYICIYLVIRKLLIPCNKFLPPNNTVRTIRYSSQTLPYHTVQFISFNIILSANRYAA